MSCRARLNLKKQIVCDCTGKTRDIDLPVDGVSGLAKQIRVFESQVCKQYKQKRHNQKEVVYE